MDKILMILSSVFFVAVVKVKTAMDAVIEGFQGAEGFLTVIGICGVALLGATIMLSWTSRKRRNAS